MFIVSAIMWRVLVCDCEEVLYTHGLIAPSTSHYCNFITKFTDSFTIFK